MNLPDGTVVAVGYFKGYYTYLLFFGVTEVHRYAPVRNRGSATGFPHIQMEQNGCGGIGLKGIVEERAVELGTYILENKTTVRKAAKKFGISKSTVHTEVIK